MTAPQTDLEGFCAGCGADPLDDHDVECPYYDECAECGAEPHENHAPDCPARICARCGDAPGNLDDDDLCEGCRLADDPADGRVSPPVEVEVWGGRRRLIDYPASQSGHTHPSPGPIASYEFFFDKKPEEKSDDRKKDRRENPGKKNREG